MATFDEFCRRHRATYDEVDKLAWHLAMFRARKIYEALRPQPKYPYNRVKEGPK